MAKLDLLEVFHLHQIKLFTMLINKFALPQGISYQATKGSEFHKSKLKVLDKHIKYRIEFHLSYSCTKKQRQTIDNA